MNAAKPEDIKKAREEAEKKMHAEAPPVPEEVDFYIRLTDHKKVGGTHAATQADVSD